VEEVVKALEVVVLVLYLSQLLRKRSQI